MAIAITGDVSNFVINQSSSTNGIQAENGNINGNESLTKANKKSQGTNNSLSSVGIEGAVDSTSEASSVTGLVTDTCDFNRLPFRAATVTASGAWGATGATQVDSGSGGAMASGQNGMNAQVATSIPSVSSPINNYPSTNPPFRVAINGGTTNTVFSGSSQSGSQASTGQNAASQSSAFGISGNIERSHSIGQDGRVILVDQNGNLADPSNPTATPGYDANTNTAPGQAFFAIFSGAVSIPSLFIPGPIPGDPDQTVPPPLKSSVKGNIKSSSLSRGSGTQKGSKGSKLLNNNSLGLQGAFNNFVFSQIGIA